MYINLMKNKKGQYLWIFVVLALIGFVISIFIENPAINYVVVLISGFGLGALMYEKRDEMKTHYVIAAIAFISGYVLGVRTAIRMKLAVIFLVSIVFGYFIYKHFSSIKNTK